MQDAQRSRSSSTASSSSSKMVAPTTTTTTPRNVVSPERQARRAAALQRRREQNRLAQARRRQRSDTLLTELQDDVHRLRKQLEARDQFIARLKAGKVVSDASRPSTSGSSGSSSSQYDDGSSSGANSRKHARSSSVSSNNSSLDSILDSHAALQASAFMATTTAAAAMPYPGAEYMLQQQPLLSPPASPTLVYDAATDTCLPASTTAWVTAQQAVMGAWDHSHHDHFTSAALTAAAAASCFLPAQDDHMAGLSSPSFYAGSEVATPMTPLTPVSPTAGMRPSVAHQRAASDSILPLHSRAFAPVADANASPRTWQALLQQLSVSTPPQATAAAQAPLWDASMPSVLRPVM